jgi:Ni,Fe-hydrogenase III component G
MKTQKVGEKTSKKTKSVQTSRKTPENTKKEALVKELKGLLSKLDEEGLNFLIEQAQIHIYNMHIDEINQYSSLTNEKSSQKTQKKPTKELRIEAAGDKSSYYIVYNGQWIMFTDEEMLQIVKIVSVKDSKEELADRLYRWFERERTDIFGVIPIENQFDEELFKLISLIKKTFKIKFR